MESVPSFFDVIDVGLSNNFNTNSHAAERERRRVELRRVELLRETRERERMQAERGEGGEGGEEDRRGRFEEIEREKRKKREAEKERIRLLDEKRKRDTSHLFDYDSHEVNFDKLASTAEAISENTIPWLPSNITLETFKTKDKKLLQQRLKVNAIRWHPDSFRSKFYNRIVESERENVMDRVKGVSQQVNRLRDGFKE
jgi:hypothetical protein